MEVLGLTAWLYNRLAGDSNPTEIDIGEFFALEAELSIRNLAFQSAVNLIASSLSNSEIKTFFNREEVKRDEYYLFNIEPNQNQNTTQFTQDWVSKLYRNNEVLIIEHNNMLYVADSFHKKDSTFYGATFTDVRVGTLNLRKVYKMEDVMYLTLFNDDVRKLINAMYNTYGKMIAYAQDTFQKSKGRRGILNVSALAQGKDDFKKKFDQLMNGYFKKYFESNNAVLPLYEGYSYDEQGSKTYSSETTRDIKAMIDDIYDFTARAFNMPPIILKGDVASSADAHDRFLTSCIDPLAKNFQTEATRKRCGREAFIAGTYHLVDTTTIKHIDIISRASNIEKLISSGAFCINDVLELIGKPAIDEEWAKQHYITKNFDRIEELLKEQRGGGNNEDDEK